MTFSACTWEQLSYVFIALVYINYFAPYSAYLLYIHSILFYSILFYSILFYSILFYSILFYSILFYSILFYSKETISQGLLNSNGDRGYLHGLMKLSSTLCLCLVHQNYWKNLINHSLYSYSSIICLSTRHNSHCFTLCNAVHSSTTPSTKVHNRA